MQGDDYAASAPPEERGDAARYKYRSRSRTTQKLVEEAYRRSDVPCGSALCGSCERASPRLSASAACYFVLNGASLRAYAELLELPDVCNVILLASGVREVLASANTRSATRLRELLADPRRSVHLLHDSHVSGVADEAAQLAPCARPRAATRTRRRLRRAAAARPLCSVLNSSTRPPERSPPPPAPPLRNRASRAPPQPAPAAPPPPSPAMAPAACVPRTPPR